MVQAVQALMQVLFVLLPSAVAVLVRCSVCFHDGF